MIWMKILQTKHFLKKESFDFMDTSIGNTILQM